MSVAISFSPTKPDIPQKKFRSSCDECHNSKSKCSGGNPCNTCARLGISCVYGPSNRIGRPRGTKNKKTLARLSRIEEAENNSSNRANSTVTSILDAAEQLCGASRDQNNVDSWVSVSSDAGVVRGTWDQASASQTGSEGKGCQPFESLATVPDHGLLDIDCFAPKGSASSNMSNMSDISFDGPDHQTLEMTVLTNDKVDWIQRLLHLTLEINCRSHRKPLAQRCRIKACGGVQKTHSTAIYQWIPDFPFTRLKKLLTNQILILIYLLVPSIHGIYLSIHRYRLPTVSLRSWSRTRLGSLFLCLNRNEAARVFAHKQNSSFG